MVNGDLLKPNEIVDSLAIYVVSYTIAHKDDKEELDKIMECVEMIEKIIWWKHEK